MPIVDYTELVEKSARLALRDEAARLQSDHVEVVPLFKIGIAWEEIIAAAKRLDVGLIVMGTHGRRCLSRVLMGSVAEKVVRLSPVSVLTIHGSDVHKATKSSSGDGQMPKLLPSVAAGPYSTVSRQEPSPANAGMVIGQQLTHGHRSNDSKKERSSRPELACHGGSGLLLRIFEPPGVELAVKFSEMVGVSRSLSDRQVRPGASIA
jgi:hypothetical protein